MPPLVSRAVALLILVALIVAFVLGVAKPVVAHFYRYSDAIEEVELDMLRYTRMAKGKQPLSKAVAELQKTRDELNLIIVRETPDLATADLQQKVNEVVGRHGGNLKSTQVLPIEKDGNFVRIAIRVQLDGDAATLRGILRDLEADRPLLFIDDVSVRPARVTRKRVNRKIVTTESGSSTISFVLAGYMRGQGSV